MSTVRDAIQTAIEKAGGGAAVGRALGLTRQAIYQWTEIPPQHVLKLEEISGVPRHELRPDLYPKDREAIAEPERAPA